MKHIKKMLQLCCGLATILAILILQTGLADAATLSCGSWNISNSPNVGTSSDLAAITRVPNSSQLWAVGGYANSSNSGLTLIENWNGTNWSIISSPNVGSSGNALSGVAAASATNVWAVGSYLNSNGTSQTLTEHWNGKSWKIVSSPDPGQGPDYLNAITRIPGTKQFMAVGFYVDNTGAEQTLIEQWNGTSWQVVPSPSAGSSNDLYGVVALSASNIWAVGTIGPSRQLVDFIHWDGTSWSTVTAQNIGFGPDLNAITGLSSKNFWSVGEYQDMNTFSFQTLVEHWNGTKWKIVSSPNVGTGGNELNGVVAVSSSDIWAVGFSCSDSVCVSGIRQTLIEHWDGTSWTIIPSPNVGSGSNGLNAVVNLPLNNTVWAVGSYVDSGGNDQTLVESYC